jgi:hypothetical protein
MSLNHTDHFEDLARLGGGARARLQYRHPLQSRTGSIIAADLDAPAQRVLAIPALPPQFLADDDGRGAIRLVFLAERPARQDGNSKSREIVPAYDVLPGVMDHARTGRVVRGAGKRHAAVAH